ncbi:upstream activation factor subunit spp27-like isoform X2 [Centruroides sculpturatus]|uniref:upstream activation factor subunit spp27-like isoform X2 n=1 Tax=Centruroides sculpturatus TaxID=218467 RepID=UPI000C6DD0F8|nr:upstream activation factor subunit spp27-like isoform X2 [Centruroides sculpturatus]
MSDISDSELKKSINEILQGADLNRTSARKVRKQLEEKYQMDLTKKKKDIDDIIMNIITESKQNENSEEESPEEEGSDEEYESESEEDVPKKKPKVTESKKSKRKKAESSSESDWEESTRKSSSKKEKKNKPKKENSYTKKLLLSPELAELVGAKEMARSDIVKKMWEIVRERDLFDPNNKQFIICDAQLKKIFGEERIRMFGVMKYLKAHLTEQK